MNDNPRKTVLVVEDEPLIRLFASDMIEDAGFAVIGAASATEAIKVLASGDDVDIVFTDVDMPGALNGIELAIHIRDRWPPIKIIVTSGKSLPARTEIPAEVAFLAKPSRQDRIIEMLHRMAA